MNQRIAIISDWFLPRFGGLELYLRDLTGALRAADMEVEIITPIPGPAIVDSISVHRLCDMNLPNGGYTFPPSPSASNFKDFLYNLDLFFRPRSTSALRRLKELLRAERFDLVHVHLGNTPFSFAATNVCIGLGLPTVLTFHSTLGRGEIPIAWMLAKLAGCSSWPGKVHLSAVSSNVADVRRPLLANAPIELLPNAIDTEAWSNVSRGHIRRQPEGGGVRRIELGAAMRLHARKRPSLLLEAMKAMKAEAPGDVAFHLKIAGDGPLRGALQERIMREGLEDCVHLCGNLEREEMYQFMSDIDLFLMPSVLESFGIAALEARTAGVPVLAMQEAGVRDFLTDGVDSMLVESDEAFTAALLRYATDAHLRDQLDQGCHMPLEGYSWANLVERCEAIYSQLTRPDTN